MAAQLKISNTGKYTSHITCFLFCQNDCNDKYFLTSIARLLFIYNLLIPLSML